MSTTPIPSKPTEADVYAEYQKMLDTLNEQCESTTGADATEKLNAAAQTLSDMLTDKNKVHLEANAAAFTTLTPEMHKSNEALKKLKGEIDQIADKIADAGKVLSAINSVLSLTSKFV